MAPALRFVRLIVVELMEFKATDEVTDIARLLDAILQVIWFGVASIVAVVSVPIHYRPP